MMLEKNVLRKGRERVGTLFLLCVLFCTSCRAPVRPSSSQEICFAVDTRFRFEDLNPFGGVRYIAFQPLFGALYSSLLALDGEGRLQNRLLESEVRQGRVVTLTLKKGIRFSDGSAITSRDLLWSLIDSFLVPRPNPLYTVVEGGEETVTKGERFCRGLSVIDERTLRITLKEEGDRYRLFLAQVGNPVLPEGGLRRRWAFSGPFYVEKFSPGEGGTLVVLRRNRFFQGPWPGNIERVHFHFFDSPALFEKEVEMGHPDLFFNFRSPELPKMGRGSPYLVYRTPFSGGVYLLLNPKREALSNPRLRRRIRDIIDGAQFVKRYGWITYIPSQHILPNALKESRLFRYPERERESVVVGKRARKMVYLSYEYGIRNQLFQYLKERLAGLGIELEKRVVERERYWADFDRADFDITAIYHLMDVADSFSFFESVFLPGMGMNSVSRVPEADALLAVMRRERDPIKRIGILNALENIAQRESFFLPLVTPVSVIGYKKKVRGLRLSCTMELPFQELSVAKNH